VHGSTWIRYASLVRRSSLVCRGGSVARSACLRRALPTRLTRLATLTSLNALGCPAGCSRAGTSGGTSATLLSEPNGAKGECQS